MTRSPLPSTAANVELPLTAAFQNPMCTYYERCRPTGAPSRALSTCPGAPVPKRLDLYAHAKGLELGDESPDAGLVRREVLAVCSVKVGLLDEADL